MLLPHLHPHLQTQEGQHDSPEVQDRVGCALNSDSYTTEEVTVPARCMYHRGCPDSVVCFDISRTRSSMARNSTALTLGSSPSADAAMPYPPSLALRHEVPLLQISIPDVYSCYHRGPHYVAYR